MAINSFNGRMQTVELDFGAASDFTSTFVADTNVRPGSQLQVSLAGRSADHDVEDALLEQLIVCAENNSPDGFTIYAHAPNGTWGRYNVNVACTYF